MGTITAVLKGGPEDGRITPAGGIVVRFPRYLDDMTLVHDIYYRVAGTSLCVFDRTEPWNPPPAPPYTRRERFREFLYRLRRHSPLRWNT